MVSLLSDSSSAANVLEWAREAKEALASYVSSRYRRVSVDGSTIWFVADNEQSVGLRIEVEDLANALADLLGEARDYWGDHPPSVLLERLLVVMLEDVVLALPQERGTHFFVRMVGGYLREVASLDSATPLVRPDLPLPGGPAGEGRWSRASEAEP